MPMPSYSCVLEFDSMFAFGFITRFLSFVRTIASFLFDLSKMYSLCRAIFAFKYCHLGLSVSSTLQDG